MRKFIIIIFILFSIHFWRYGMIPPSFHRLTDFLSISVLFFVFLKMVSRENLIFKKAIIVFLIGIFLNVLSAYLNNGQSPRDTLLSFGPYYFILFYFFLHMVGPKTEELENIIIAFGVIYAILYIYQSVKFPVQIFDGSMYRDRGTIRIRIEGSGFLMFAYFLLLNKYLIKRKIPHIIIALFLFLIMIKSGFRTLILGGILISGMVFIRLVKYSILNYLLIVVAVIMFIGLFQLPSTSRIINNMINTSKEQINQGDKYIRVIQYQYFSKEYPKNFSYYIIGGGLPGGYGAYTRYMGYIIQRYGFYWEDLGLIGFYFVIGLVTLVGLLWYTLKAIFTELPPDGFYLKAFFAYLLIVSFTTMEIFRPGIFAVEAIGLYLIDLKLYNNNEQEISSQNHSLNLT